MKKIKFVKESLILSNDLRKKKAVKRLPEKTQNFKKRLLGKKKHCQKIIEKYRFNQNIEKKKTFC